MSRNAADRGKHPPLLENGDRLTRAEFERRYEALPALKKAELIEGVVYVPSPVRHQLHGKPHSRIITWLGVYAARTPGIDCSDNATVRLDLDNEPQPDALLFVGAGQARVDADGYLRGAPELIAEVAASSASYDLGAKKNAYRRNGVQEYVVWRVLDEELDWFSLQESSYQPLQVSKFGILESTVFPGLWLDPAALLEDRLDRVLEVLEQGLASPEHLAFKSRLAEPGSRY